MRKIGGNRFYDTLRGAKMAAARQGETQAEVVETDEGFCLLGQGEGCTDKSYELIETGTTVSRLHGEQGWFDEE